MRTTGRWPSGHSGARAFTLIEMLIVIAIVGVLASLMLPMLTSGRSSASMALCAGNLSQLYVGLRIYASHYDDMVPDLYAGYKTTDASQYNERYVNSHYARHKVKLGPPGNEVEAEIPTGLWLMYVTRDAFDKGVYYCPETPGPKGYGGSENKVVDGVPRTLGTSYNCFPDTVGGTSIVPLPAGLSLEDVTNIVSQMRNIRFYALLGDVFVRSDEMPHALRRSINVCYWDRSVQPISLTARGILWNKDDTNLDGVKYRTFTTDQAGATAVRDTWVLLSQARH